MNQQNLAPFIRWLENDWLEAIIALPADLFYSTGIVGYEINFNRYFYVYQPPRPLAEIDADLKAVEAEIAVLLSEVTA